jgi:hypothetical protein
MNAKSYLILLEGSFNIEKGCKVIEMVKETVIWTGTSGRLRALPYCMDNTQKVLYTGGSEFFRSQLGIDQKVRQAAAKLILLKV